MSALCLGLCLGSLAISEAEAEQHTGSLPFEIVDCGLDDGPVDEVVRDTSRDSHSLSLNQPSLFAQAEGPAAYGIRMMRRPYDPDVSGDFDDFRMVFFDHAGECQMAFHFRAVFPTTSGSYFSAGVGVSLHEEERVAFAKLSNLLCHDGSAERFAIDAPFFRSDDIILLNPARFEHFADSDECEQMIERILAHSTIFVGGATSVVGSEANPASTVTWIGTAVSGLGSIVLTQYSVW